MTGWTPLDQSLARSLVASGVLSREAVSAVWARGPTGSARYGSQLADALVRQGVVPAPTVDGVLNTLSGASAPGGAATIVTGTPPPAGGGAGGVPAAVRESFAGERYEPLGGVGGDVVPALDRRLQRKVALHLGPGAQDPAAHSFLREGRVLAQLDHPAIPKVHDLGVLGGRAFYALDLLGGRSLEEGGEAPLPARLRAFLAVAAGVEHAHGRGLVHGALRPACVRLGRYGQVWVTGWGEAVAADGADEAAQRAVAAAPLASEAEDDELAPERRRGKPLTPATDVWGLGLILHWALLGRLPDGGVPKGGAPAELLAVARKALAAANRSRYRSVAALGEDVRRYLDHRRVEAADETLLLACRRLARRYPVPAAGAGLVAAAFVVTAGLALYFGSAEAARLRAHAEEVRAQEVALAARQAEQDQARAAALGAAERAKQGQELERRLLAAVASVPVSEAERAAAPAFAPVEELLGELDAPELRARFYAARGWWFMDHGRPDRAAPDFARASELAPSDVEAAFGSYLAAKRLPGPASRQAEERALAGLERLGSVPAELARAVRTVAEVYAAAARAEDVAGRADEALALLETLRTEVARWPRVRTHLGELTGIAHHCRIGLYTVASTLYPRWRVGDEEKRAHLWPGNAALKRAMQGDPAAVEPRVLYLREHGIRWAYQATWRSSSAIQLRHLERVVELSRRPETWLEVAERLQVDRRAAESLPYVERFFAAPPSERPTGDALARARVLRARALLHAGRLPDASDLAGLPDEYDLDRQALLAWIDLRRGKLREGLEALGQLQRRQPRHYYELWRYQDLSAALVDPAVDARTLARALSRVPRRWDGRGQPAPFVQAAVLAAARAGQLSEADHQLLAQLRQAYLLSEGLRGEPGLARLLVAWSRALGGDPRAHGTALLVWASLNLNGFTNARQVRDARALVIARLRSAGAGDAARAFEQVAAIEDVWPPRASVPPLVRISEETVR